MSSYGLDLLVDSFNFTRGYFIGGMSNDSLKMIIKKLTEPDEMLIVCRLTDFYYVADFYSHFCFHQSSYKPVIPSLLPDQE